MRLQLALNVSNPGDAVAYWSRFFGIEPHKQEPAYADFAIDEPPLKLAFFKNPKATKRLNHLGVEVFDKGSLDAAVERLQKHGIAEAVRATGVCCHAEQDQIWSVAPDEERWEWYQVVNDAPETGETDCCS